jgi:hypothetical protein
MGEEIRSGPLDLSTWTNSRWIQRKVHERSSEMIRTIHRQEDRWQKIRGVHGTGHQEICKEKRRKLMKGGVMKSFWTIGSGRTRGRDPHTHWRIGHREIRGEDKRKFTKGEFMK